MKQINMKKKGINDKKKERGIEKAQKTPRQAKNKKANYILQL